MAWRPMGEGGDWASKHKPSSPGGRTNRAAKKREAKIAGKGRFWADELGWGKAQA